MEDIMSSANIKLVQDVYAAFGRGDLPTVLDAMTPDVAIGIVGRQQDAPLFGLHHGEMGAPEFFRLLDEAHEITHFEPQQRHRDAGTSLSRPADGQAGRERITLVTGGSRIRSRR